MTTQRHIDQFRHFNRFYTNYLGLLADTMYGSRVGLTEARILFELDKTPGSSARELCSRLGLDKGYLSRIVKGFVKQGWVEATPSQSDARVKELALTQEGGTLMETLHRQATEQVRDILHGLDPGNRDRLLQAMADIEKIIAGHPLAKP